MRMHSKGACSLFLAVGIACLLFFSFAAPQEAAAAQNQDSLEINGFGDLVTDLEDSLNSNQKPTSANQNTPQLEEPNPVTLVSQQENAKPATDTMPVMAKTGAGVSSITIAILAALLGTSCVMLIRTHRHN